MKRILISLICLFWAYYVNAQLVPAGLPSPSSNGFAKYGYVKTDSAGIAAQRDTTWNPKYVGSWVYWQNPASDSSFWVFNGKTVGKKWDKVVMVSQGNINGYLKITDTASMLTGYLRNATIGFTVQPYNAATTLLGNTTTGTGSTIVLSGSPTITTPTIGAIINSGNTITVPSTSGLLALRSDTGRVSSILVTGGALNKVRDSLVALISAGGFGTVFSVATTNGTGIISSVANPTTSPNITIRVDTNRTVSAIVTGGSLNKVRDSIMSVIGASLALKLNISDTTSMMSGYRRNSVNITNANLVNSTISGTALGGTLPNLNFGTYLQAGATSYNGTTAVTMTTNATSSNLGTTLVARDANGDFSARNITASLLGNASSSSTSAITDNAASTLVYPTWVSANTGNLSLQVTSTKLSYNPSSGALSSTSFVGNLSGNATTASTLQTPRTINGVSFDGSANITISASVSNSISAGYGLTGSSYDGSLARTWTADTTKVIPYTDTLAIWGIASKGFVRNYITATSPIFFNGSTGVISSQAATSGQNGYLTSTDWSTFNGKQPQLNGTGFVKASGTTISYDNSTYLTTTTAGTTYVPYTGATGAVNLGSNTLNSGAITAKGTGSFNGNIAADNTGTTGSGSFNVYQNGVPKGTFALAGAIFGNTDVNNAYQSATGAGHYWFVNGATTQSMILNSSGALTLGSTSGTGTGALYSGAINASSDLTLSATDGKIIGGTTTGRAIFGNSGTTTYGTFYGATHATNANQIVFVNNSAVSLTLASTGAATFASTINSGAITSSGLITGLNVQTDGATSTPSLVMINTGGNRFELYPDATGFKVFNRTSSTYPLIIANSGAATFSSNVGLGVAPLSGGASAKWLTADGTSVAGGGLISSLSGVGKAYYYYDGTYAAVQGSTGIGVALQYNGGTNALTINGTTGLATFSGSVAVQSSTASSSTSTGALVVTGGVGVGGSIYATSIFQTSDERLKNIIERNGDLITFTWKDKRDKLIHYGYSAQSINKDYPMQVSKGETWGVNYTEILVKKVADLEEKVKQLEEYLDNKLKNK